MTPRPDGAISGTNAKQVFAEHFASGAGVASIVESRGFRQISDAGALGAATLVVAAYPSRGLDVATTRRTQELLLEQRAAGAGVLLISEDLDELFEMSDRIVVLHAGRVVGEVSPASADRYEVGRLMMGTDHEDAPSESVPAGVGA